MDGRDAEMRLYSRQSIADFGMAAQIIGNGPFDDGGAKASPGRRDHRRAAAFGPVDQQAAIFIHAPVDLHGAAVRQGAIFGGVGQHFVDHQRQHGEATGRQQHIGTGQLHPIATFAQISARFDFDQVVEARRAPAVSGNLIMGAGQRMDAAFQRADKFVHRTGAVARLRQQAPDQREDVADAMIKFRDQQFLLLMRALPLRIGGIGHAQYDFEQRGAQRFGHPQFGGQEGQRHALHQLRPGFETLARGQARAIRPIFDFLFRIACPAHGSQLFGAEQHDIIARPARQGDREYTRHAIGIGRRFGQNRGEAVGGIDLARRNTV